MELSKLGERKQAIFCVIPDSNDNSLNFLVGLLYTQAFQELYYQADKVHMGGLPVPVRLMFDEFANVALPDGYARLQATMRSRNIMATIILQNISQLKALFKDDWEGIIGNADTLSISAAMSRVRTNMFPSFWARRLFQPNPAVKARGETDRAVKASNRQAETL